MTDIPQPNGPADVPEAPPTPPGAVPPPGAPTDGVPPPRVERRPDDAVLRGVCAALARATGTDPLLWRISVAVLALFGGLGLLLYGVGYVLIPVRGEGQSLGERLLRGPDRRVPLPQLLVVAAVVVLALALVGDPRSLLLPALVLGGLAFLASRRSAAPGWPMNRGWSTAGAYGGGVPTGRTSWAAAPGRSREARSAASTRGWPETAPGTSAAGAAAAPAWDGRSWDAGGSAAVPWPAPRVRERSALPGITLAAVLLVTGMLLLLSVLGLPHVTASRVLAVDLAVVGIGLVVGTWWGRARGLVWLALLLAVALGVSAIVTPTVSAGLGDRTWVPTQASGTVSYRLGAGDATLDLTRLPLSAAAPGVEVRAKVTVGRLVVLLPAGARVSLSARAGVGEVVLPVGTGTPTDDRRVDTDLGPPGTRQVRLVLQVRAGAVEVRRG